MAPRSGRHSSPAIPTPAGTRARGTTSAPRRPPLKKKRWAYEATILTSASPRQSADAPRVPLAFLLDRPGYTPGSNAITVLRDWKAHHPGDSWLAADKNYTNAVPEDFQLPARALGARLVLDYRKDQLGVHATYGGALLIEGTWYCPAIPAGLATATIDYYAGKFDKTTWQRLIEARRQYALIPKDRAENRWLCPAFAKLRCDRRRESLLGREDRLRVRPESTVPFGTICSAQSMRIPWETGAKLAQELPHATPEWAAKYNALRNGVEGGNGQAKDATRAAINISGRRRLRGIAATSIAVAFQLFATAVQALRSFLETPPQKKARKRRKRPLSDYNPLRATDITTD